MRSCYQHAITVHRSSRLATRGLQQFGASLAVCIRLVVTPQSLLDYLLHCFVIAAIGQSIQNKAYPC